MSRMLGNLWTWIDARLPVQRAWDTHMGRYYAPKNFNFWYIFGVLALVILVNQILTGIWLTMHYTPSAEAAFASVEYIMRDVPYGWLLRYMHSTGASAFFAVVYLHMFRSLMYGSYKAPRELIWIFGMLIYVVLMAEAFMGYVLPWGQMSYWGAQVIVNLFGAIPVVGEDLVQWIRGDYLISGATLTRFFALHVVAMPIVLLALVVLHLLALHEVGSNNPDGIEIKKNKDANGIPLDGVPFHPYYVVHDLVGIAVFLFVFCSIIFFMPEMGGFFLEHANFEPANALKTPEHIAPVWYFTPFYAILRAITFEIGPLDSKFLGFMTMAAAIAILFVLPWLDKSPVKSLRYKGNISRVALIVFVAAFVILGYLGVQPPTPGRTILAQVCTALYFAYFIGMPFWTRRETCRPVPERVQMKGLDAKLVWGAVALFLVLVIVPIRAVAAAEGGPCGEVPCESFRADPFDQASMQNGARLYMNYCLSCHSLSYVRYQRIADDLGIPEQAMLDNLIFTEQRIGELVTNSMDPASSQVWFGVPPPDLSLVTRSRSDEWVYTYLLNFYRDDTRPTGVNNKVFPNVAMPHVLMELQGLPECAPGPRRDESGRVMRNSVGEELAEPCGSLAVRDVVGTMEPEEFKQAMYDLTNFLVYVEEPAAIDRRRMGGWVLLFLTVFFVFAWLLSREYWKDVH